MFLKHFLWNMCKCTVKTLCIIFIGFLICEKRRKILRCWLMLLLLGFKKLGHNRWFSICLWISCLNCFLNLRSLSCKRLLFVDWKLMQRRRFSFWLPLLLVTKSRCQHSLFENGLLNLFIKLTERLDGTHSYATFGVLSRELFLFRICEQEGFWRNWLLIKFVHWALFFGRGVFSDWIAAARVV